MNEPIVIIGAGLAGLSLAIDLARRDIQVVVLERSHFPRQKVCGEYISLESKTYLEWLGIDTSAFPIIKRLRLTSLSGREAHVPLEPGGMGISRWYLDSRLAEIAVSYGVDVRFGVNVRAIQGDSVITAEHGTIRGSFVVGAFGRNNPLGSAKRDTSTTYIGVKYHVKSTAPIDVIEMHVFRGGYCGFSKVEDDLYCLCYLADAQPLKDLSGDLERFERLHLFGNPMLKRRFAEVEKMVGPITTSGMSFGTVGKAAAGQVLLGDAMGFIPPITGNGMSLALRSAANLAPELARLYHTGSDIRTFLGLQDKYVREYLNRRIIKGKFLHRLLKQRFLSDFLLFSLLKTFPLAGKLLARQATGKEIIRP